MPFPQNDGEKQSPRVDVSTTGLISSLPLSDSPEIPSADRRAGREHPYVAPDAVDLLEDLVDVKDPYAPSRVVGTLPERAALRMNDDDTVALVVAHQRLD